MSITLEEIANKAGCSKTSASLILGNRKHSISDKLCRKVETLAEKYNYRKKQRSSDIITFVTPNNVSESTYYMGVVSGLGDYLNTKGYVLSTAYHEKKDKETEWFRNEHAVNDASGIILSTPPDKELIEYLKLLDVPVVTLGFKTDGFSAVSSEILSSTIDAMRFLKEKGVENVGFIGDISTHPDYCERYQCFLAAISFNGLSFDRKHFVASSVDAHISYDSMKKYLGENKKNLPEVFVCATQVEAMGAMKAITESGLKIPGDIGTLAFGYANFPYPFTPSLSIIKTDNHEEGKLLGKILVHSINNKKELEDVYCKIKTRFHKEKSC